MRREKAGEYAIMAGLLLWIIAFYWIMSASRSCGESGAIWELQGLCLLRRLAGISCILGIELAFGVGGGLQAQGRGYPFIMGFLLGFFFSALGAFFVMALSPKQMNVAPMSPEKERRRLYLLIAFLCLIAFWVLLGLQKLGERP